MTISFGVTKPVQDILKKWANAFAKGVAKSFASLAQKNIWKLGHFCLPQTLEKVTTTSIKHMSFFGAIKKHYFFETPKRGQVLITSIIIWPAMLLLNRVPSQRNSVRTSVFNFHLFFYERTPCPTFWKGQKRCYILTVGIALSRIKKMWFHDPTMSVPGTWNWVDSVK